MQRKAPVLTALLLVKSVSKARFLPIVIILAGHPWVGMGGATKGPLLQRRRPGLACTPPLQGLVPQGCQAIRSAVRKAWLKSREHKRRIWCVRGNG